MEKVTRFLPVKLTEAETLEMAKTMGEKMLEVDNLESEKKAFMAKNKLQSEGLEAELSQLGKCVREGSEEREVECLWNFNTPVRGMKQLVRLDNYEVIDEKDMTDNDKRRVADLNQTRLPIDEPTPN